MSTEFQASSAAADAVPSSSDDAVMRRARAVRWLIPVFLGSGATSLVYQTLWARQLHHVFGTSQLAICTVLAAFMGGLGLGGLVAARWAGRACRPMHAYAYLEAFIGAYALVFPLLVWGVEPLYLGFYSAFQPSQLTFGLFQFAVLGVLLLIPTACMGATLPLLARFVTAEREEAGSQIGRLYGANTLGAVLGTALAGFVLLPLIGIATTTWITALANFVLAGLAIALSRTTAPLANEEQERPQAASPLMPGLLVIAGIAGFSGLLMEVAWFRLMALMLGGSAYAFSLMLLAFLLGIGIGGWAGGPWSDRSWAKGGDTSVLKVLCGIQVGVALLTWLAMHAYGELPFLYVWLFKNVGHSSAALWAANLFLSLLVMLAPALLMGATFPFLVRAAAGDPDEVSRPVGLIYGVNTFAAIAGAAGGGLLLLPWLHVRGSVVLAVSSYLVSAFVALLLAWKVAGKLNVRHVGLGVSGLVVSIALLAALAAPWDPLLMTSGMYKYSSDLEEFTREEVLEYAVAPYELLFYDEGLSSVVTVAGEKKADGSLGNIWLANNGKVDASSRTDLMTQLTFAHLPLAFRPESKSVMVIGLASGISVGSCTLHDAVEQIDVVEIEEATVEASTFFKDHNYDALTDERVRVLLNDARNQLALTPDGTYDLVLSEPSNPWLTGVSNLFTREFFGLAKTKLAPGGIWCQWVQSYGMAPEDLKSVLATLADTWEHVEVFRVDSSDNIVLASDEPIDVGIPAFETLFRTEALRRDLLRIRFRSPEQFLAMYQFGRPTLMQLTEGVGLNTDDNMRIEYSAPLHLHEDTGDANSMMLHEVAVLPLETVDRQGLLLLIMAYNDLDPGWRRAIAATDIALEQARGDEALSARLRMIRGKLVRDQEEYRAENLPEGLPEGGGAAQGR